MKIFINLSDDKDIYQLISDAIGQINDKFPDLVDIRKAILYFDKEMETEYRRHVITMTKHRMFGPSTTYFEDRVYGIRISERRKVISYIEYQENLDVGT